ncbi:right-handed parallel beta-helix repeat-containing protein [Promicromonospora panici]|uniref:right-handed parallel beta-helix repeat-containing protein n=1 Tax=Promicromonospora panici TaxID=2219658 RepID=UPI00101CC9FE|nr:right-handed parallel beta-helix repeat-containing protein [Promicromonospora panici]
MHQPVTRRNMLWTAGLAGLATATGAVAMPLPAASAAPDEPDPEPPDLADPTLATLDISGATTPQEFGAVADGVNDDTAAIQAAIDAQFGRLSKIVWFPPGTYRITSPLVVPDTEFTEPMNLNRITLAGQGTMGVRTSLILVDFDGTGIEMHAPLCGLRGLSFITRSRTPNTIAVHTSRTNNTDDMDATITECTFVSFNQAVLHIGRGLVFTNNLVAISGTALTVQWPTGGTEGGDVHLLPYGMRKWLIEGNHFHSMGQCIAVTGAENENFRGAIISNNLVDIGRRFFTGGIINSTIVGNVIEHASGPVVDVTAGGTNLTITGNVIGGGGEEPDTRRPPNAILFRGVDAHNITITGNTFNWINLDPVAFEQSAYEITISANSFDHWNLERSVIRAAVRIAGDATGVSVMGNAFGANTVAGNAPVRVAGTLTGSTISGNVLDPGAPVLMAGTVGEDCYVQRRSADANEHELTSVKNGASVIRATAADGYADSDAYGSFLATSAQVAGAGPGVKGGVRVVPSGGTGAAVVELVAATAEANGVAAVRVGADGVVPTTDNERDLGSAELRMRTVHTHRLQLVPNSVAELPEPVAGGIVMVPDALGPFPTLAVSDGEHWYRVIVAGYLASDGSTVEVPGAKELS